MNRRNAIKNGAAMTVGTMLHSHSLADTTSPSQTSPTPLRILILGGTGFIGPHFVRALQAGGHQLTLFNRGKRHTDTPAGIELLTGDRNGDVESLKAGTWDAVIDNSGYLPKQVRLTTELLKERVPYYLFISSIAVYADWKHAGIEEDYPLATLDDPDTEDIGRHYGALKAACEKIVTETYASQAALVRPTYIVGPGDTTERFTYWPARTARGGTMLAPGTPSDLMQFIDVRDLADFIRHCVEQRLTGAYNACHPPRSTTIGAVLDTSKHISGADTHFVWVNRDFLLSQKMLPSAALPLYTDPEGPAFGATLVSSTKSEAHGLRFRDLKITIVDTLAWHQQRPAEHQQPKAWLTAERETSLLQLWKERPQ